jgi:hypothetical protein
VREKKKKKKKKEKKVRERERERSKWKRSIKKEEMSSLRTGFKSHHVVRCILYLISAGGSSRK